MFTAAALLRTHPTPTPPHPASSGILYGLPAWFAFGGDVPLFFKQLHASAIEVVLHRMVWFAQVRAHRVTVLRRWNWLGDVPQPRPALQFAVSVCCWRATGSALRLGGEEQPCARRQPGLLHPASHQRGAGLHLLH